MLTIHDRFTRGKNKDPSVYPPGHRLNPSTQYLLQIPAAYQKHQQSWFVWLPEHMTVHVDYWRSTFGKETDEWLILNEAGKQVTSVAASTKMVTNRLIKRKITAHRFRNCLTSFFKHQGGLDSVEKTYYRVFRQNTEKTAEGIYDNKVQAFPVCQKLHSMLS